MGESAQQSRQQAAGGGDTFHQPAPTLPTSWQHQPLLSPHRLSCRRAAPTSIPNSKNSRWRSRCTGHMVRHTAALMAAASASLRGARGRWPSVALSDTAGAAGGVRLCVEGRVVRKRGCEVRHVSGALLHGALARSPRQPASHPPDDSWSMMASATSGAAPSTRDTM